jgi:hypothetical protein
VSTVMLLDKYIHFLFFASDLALVHNTLLNIITYSLGLWIIFIHIHNNFVNMLRSLILSIGCYRQLLPTNAFLFMDRSLLTTIPFFPLTAYHTVQLLVVLKLPGSL